MRPESAYLGIVMGLAMGLSGCDATIELTKAPFDATTDISDGIFAATSDLTEPTRAFLSSTTPGAQGPNVAHDRLAVFAAYSHENIRADVARGEGEYLISLATLAGVPQQEHDAFRVSMRNAYANLFADQLTARESSARVVNAAWDLGLGRAPAQP